MSDRMCDRESLSAELGALRSALLEVRAPDDEPALRSAARVHAVEHSAGRRRSAAQPAIVARALRRRALALTAAAAVAAVAVLAALRTEWFMSAERAQRVELAPEHGDASSRAPGNSTAMPAAAATPDPPPAFRPIAFSRSLSTAESYSVVRVRIELASSVPRAGAPNASIEADLLVGEDGLAHAIRFDSADTLPVYAASKPDSGERR